MKIIVSTHENEIPRKLFLGFDQIYWFFHYQ